MTAVDFSFARYTAAQLKAAGVTAVVRYLTGAGKAISPVELAGDLFAGIQVGLVFENTATDASSGAGVGAAHAMTANSALKALGVPTTTPVYFAADTDYPDPNAAVPYYQGIASVRPGHTNGCYGEGKLLDLLFADGLIGYGWESESTSFPGNGSLDPNAALWQKVAGAPLGGTDLDVIVKADWGQLPRPIPIPTPPPPTPIHTPVAINVHMNGNLADVLDHGTGSWVLGTDGGIYAVRGAPFLGSAAGQSYFAGRTAATLKDYTAANGTAGYTITATSGETYNYP
jgi:hypothetical protein